MTTRERVLLCHIHPSVGVGDVWTLPGGGLEFGESPARAALRELEEETGFIGEIERLIEVDDRRVHDAGPAPTGCTRSGSSTRFAIVGGSLRDELDGSTDTCRWVAPEEALRMRLGELARRAVDAAQRPSMHSEISIEVDARRGAGVRARPGRRALGRPAPALRPLARAIARDAWGRPLVEFVARRPLVPVARARAAGRLAVADVERARDAPPAVRARRRRDPRDGRHLAHRSRADARAAVA